MSTWTRRRRALAATATGCLVVAMVMGGASGAMAEDGPYDVTGGTGIPDDGTTELGDETGNVKEVGPLNSNTTKIGVIHDDAVPTLGLTNPNAQVDLRRAWLDTEVDPVTGDDWLYFAWERDKNTGSGFIAYEFMQNPAPNGCAYDTATPEQLIAACNPWENRIADDFLILWDQQGGSLDMVLRIWEDDGAGGLILGPPDDLDDTVSQAALSSDGFRGEAAVNLTDTVFGGSDGCVSYSNTIPSTVTGNSDTADYKDTILKTAPPISNCTSTTVTTPKTGAGADIPAGGLSIGSGIVAVKDSAVVDVEGGTAIPAGTLTFSLCMVELAEDPEEQELCDSGGTPIGEPVPVSDEDDAYPVTVLSPAAYVTSAGFYCWRADFSGDAANGIPGSSDSLISECFEVDPVTPGLATSAGADVLLGNPVTDTATLSNLATDPADPVINTTGTSGPVAGGTLVFRLYGPSTDGCGPLVHTSADVAVSGNGVYDAPSFAPSAAGEYHWVADYSGSPNNNGTDHNLTCTVAAEDVVVLSVPSSLTSTQTWVPNDSVTITVPPDTGDIVGNVDFRLFNGADCTGTQVYFLLDVPVTTASPTATTANSGAVPAGTYWWQVNYDSTGNAAHRDIPNTCHETSTLSITDGDTVNSP